MRLYLVRHGQTAWNAQEKAQGHTDVPLDETGKIQAQRLAELLEGSRIDLILTSDLQRSKETAQVIADRFGAPLEATELLRERSFGEWEGLPYTEVGRRFGTAVSDKGL